MKAAKRRKLSEGEPSQAKKLRLDDVKQEQEEPAEEAAEGDLQGEHSAKKHKKKKKVVHTFTFAFFENVSLSCFS